MRRIKQVVREMYVDLYFKNLNSFCFHSLLEAAGSSSPLRNIANIPKTSAQTLANQQKPIKTTEVTPTKKRQNQVGPKPKAKRAKQSEKSPEISVPKYNYAPLNFMRKTESRNDVRGGQNARDNQQRNNQWPLKPVHVELQPSKLDSHSYSIEDSSLMDDGTQNDGTVSDSCVERENLLNQDNTLFLNINTQLMNSAGPSTNQVAQQSQPASLVADSGSVQPVPPNQTVQINQPVFVQPNCALERTVSSISIASSAIQTINHDRTEFLYHVEILNVTSTFKPAILPSGERCEQLNIEATLQHQCNGNNRIVVNGDAIKLIMNLTDKEWETVQTILKALGQFQYDARKSGPINDTILHRSMYCLFRTAPKISTVHIAYGDQDLETARVFVKPNHSNENLTSAINPAVLMAMKVKVESLQNNS